MKEDTKVYSFQDEEMAKHVAGGLFQQGYKHVHVYGEIGPIDPEGRLPTGTKYIVIATDKNFKIFDDSDWGGD